MQAAYPLSPLDVMESSPLLEDVEAEVLKLMDQEKRPSKESELERKMMEPRIAQLKDELEKKDKIIAKLKKDNSALKANICASPCVNHPHTRSCHLVVHACANSFMNDCAGPYE